MLERSEEAVLSAFCHHKNPALDEKRPGLRAGSKLAQSRDRENRQLGGNQPAAAAPAGRWLDAAALIKRRSTLRARAAAHQRGLSRAGWVAGKVR